MSRTPSSVADRKHLFENNKSFSAIFPNLSVEEMATIHAYSDKQFDKLNRYLRGEDFGADHNEVLQYIAETLSGALQKCNQFSGVVYRGTFLPPHVKAAHYEAFKKGQPVLYSYFVSTSKTYGKAFKETVDKDGNKIEVDTYYTITTKTGAAIAKLSVYGTLEDEVLINRDRYFTITDIYDRDGKTYIKMTEN